jgi:hypothetical protein
LVSVEALPVDGCKVSDPAIVWSKCGIPSELWGLRQPSTSQVYISSLFSSSPQTNFITSTLFIYITVAVLGWNLSLCLPLGNASIWAPSSTTPLVSLATTKLISRALATHRAPPALASLLCGGPNVGAWLAEEEGVDMVSFTGSEEVGRKVAAVVGRRMGKVLVEGGGNNAAIVMDDADVELAAKTIAVSRWFSN